jgi:hypothetical protein
MTKFPKKTPTPSRSYGPPWIMIKQAEEFKCSSLSRWMLQPMPCVAWTNFTGVGAKYNPKAHPQLEEGLEKTNLILSMRAPMVTFAS